MTNRGAVLIAAAGVLIACFASVGSGSQAPKPVKAQAIAEPKGELTLQQAMALVLTRNPELAGFSLDVRMAEARRLQAGLLPNPELEVEVENIGGTGELSGFKGSETTVGVSQPIELGGKREKRVKAADADTKVAAKDYEIMRSVLLAQAGRAFYKLLAAQQVVELVGEQIDQATKLVDAVSRRVQAGKDSPVELSRAQIELAQARVEQDQASTDLDMARMQMSLLWASAEPQFTAAVGDLGQMSKPEALEPLRAAALKHPSVTQWDDKIAAARAKLLLAKAQAKPDISIMGGLRRLEESNDNALVVGLAIPLGVYDRNQGGRLEATYELAKVKKLAEHARTAMLSQVAQASRRLNNAYRQSLALRDEMLPKAEEAFKAAVVAYEQGKFGYLDIVDSQRTLFSVRRNTTNALLEYQNARTDLQALTGGSAADGPDRDASLQEKPNEQK